MIGDVMTHPLGECDVSGEIFVRVTALGKALDLFFGRNIQQADPDSVEIRSTGCGVDFTGGTGSPHRRKSIPDFCFCSASWTTFSTA